MQECRFCKEIIKDGDSFCKYCGYDPKVDMISKDFIPPAAPIRPSKKKTTSLFSVGISPGVKKIVFIGLAVLVFSIFYKNNFDIGNVIAEVKYRFNMVSKGKFKRVCKFSGVVSSIALFFASKSN